jgi:uncharacterized protein (TIGR02001 family)
MALTMLPLCCLATAAKAQISASASLVSDYRFRGISLSDGQPALTVSLAYDHSSGAYAGVSLIGQDTAHDGARMLGNIEYIGYATRKSMGLSWDVGIHNENLTAYADKKYVLHYTELYAGMTSNNFSTHLYYSPNYLKAGAITLYADLDGALRPASQWRLFGHVGVQTPLGPPDIQPNRRERYDFRAGIAREFQRCEVDLAWATTSLTPANQVLPSRAGLVLSVSYFF